QSGRELVPDERRQSQCLILVPGVCTGAEQIENPGYAKATAVSGTLALWNRFLLLACGADLRSGGWRARSLLFVAKHLSGSASRQGSRHLRHYAPGYWPPMPGHSTLPLGRPELC